MDNPSKPICLSEMQNMMGVADLPSLLNFDCDCSRLQWNLYGWMFNHQFLTVSSRNSASVRIGTVSLVPGIEPGMW
jgi:hypothetical protein